MFCVDWLLRFSFFLRGGGEWKNGGHGWCSAGVGAAGMSGHAAALGCQGFLPARRGAARLCRGFFFFLPPPCSFFFVTSLNRICLFWR